MESVVISSWRESVLTTTLPFSIFDTNDVVSGHYVDVYDVSFVIL